jgi:hypothetical protein
MTFLQSLENCVVVDTSGHNFGDKLFYTIRPKIRGNVKLGYTEDPYGRITKEASSMISNRLMAYMVIVSCPEWEQYILNKLRHFQMSGEVFELDIQLSKVWLKELIASSTIYPRNRMTPDAQHRISEIYVNN